GCSKYRAFDSHRTRYSAGNSDRGRAARDGPCDFPSASRRGHAWARDLSRHRKRPNGRLMPRKSTLNGRRPRPPGFPSQSLFRPKCEAIAMIRSRVSVATLMTLATIGTASAQPIDLLVPPVAIPLPNDAPPMPPTVTYALLPGHWQLQG